VTALVGSVVLTLTSGNAAIAYVVASGIWAPLGLTVWYRKPDHPMGPLITSVGFLSLSVVPGFLMGAVFEQFEATLTQRAWPMIFGLALSGAYTYLFLIAILLFPDGRPTTTAQRWLTWLSVLALGIATVAGFLSEPLGPLPHPFAPADVAATARSVYDLMVEAYGLVLLAVIVSKYVDYRRSQSIRRAQLKWLIYVLGLYLVFTMVTFGLIGTEGFNRTGLILDAMFSGLIPLAMTIAILRYRLYEIDRLVSRTVSYALVVVIVAAVFALPVILIPTAMGGSSDWVVAGATLAAAAVFNPVRRSIQTRVDRRFNRSRYDATREVEDLAARLSAAPASEPPIEDTVELVVRLLEPAAIGVWVRG
jgi:hypothetical protein